MRLMPRGLAIACRAFLLSVLTLGAIAVPLSAQSEPPALGAKAPDFTLSTPEGAPVALSGLLAKGRVVLIVLRGYPGYQCPYCQRQAHDFEAAAGKFADRNTELLLVYPGPSGDLAAHAQEFLSHSQQLPPNFHLVIDPDYTFTNLYGLRWNAEAETAYPSTFLLDRNGTVLHRKISREHGDRTTAADVLAELDKQMM